MKKFVASKQQSYALAVWRIKKKKVALSQFFLIIGVLLLLLLFLINFKWLFVRKLLLFQARIHLFAFARIKTAPNGKKKT